MTHTTPPDVTEQSLEFVVLTSGIATFTSVRSAFPQDKDRMSFNDTILSLICSLPRLFISILLILICIS